MDALLILCFALIPPVLSLWIMRWAEVQAQQRLRAATDLATLQGLQRVRQAQGNHYGIEGLGYQIGDLTCQFNARSAYIRCAVNPYGPCQQCPHYQSIEFAE
ncbi:hypothetical protein BST81_05970 [Leptolyngbya sp. 'hensonii']|uniref:DUF6464 family protein n=1 Tax=Leptolyngbya sp. 'hensonii' TaxID=1922337 RepID=UPI00094FC1B8|nr:DUF6464 family protein [Leptolyngbya sp. 'hensonii']OLP19303.1 hypothetical protein BST81_05970 [Leptolyngbya sp. 'hensonii']